MTLTRSGDEIAAYFALMADADAVAEMDGSSLRARYNIAPTQMIPTVVRTADGLRRVEWKKWGLVPSWSKDPAMGGRLFNARSETAHEKPSFRAAWKRRRCLVMADGFYEWTPRSQGHQPYHFQSAEGTPLALAGLYEAWHGEGGEIIESCTVLTTPANADLEGIHHRMPVILDPSRFDPWLDLATDPAKLKPLTQPALPGTLTKRAVSTLVNNARFDDARCLSPVSESEVAGQVAVGSPSEKRTDSPASAAKQTEQGELFASTDENGE